MCPGSANRRRSATGSSSTAVADRIARGLAAHGVRGPFDLVGHSLGAAVALTLAAAARGPCAGWCWSRRRGWRRSRGWRRGRCRSAPTGARGPARAGAADRRRLGATAAAGVRGGRRRADPAAPGAADGRCVGDRRSGQRRRSRRSRPPTCGRCCVQASVPLGVIWGAEDRTMPGAARRSMRETRPDAEVMTIEQAGHVAMIERPEAFVATLERLLATLPKDATTRSRPGVYRAVSRQFPTPSCALTTTDRDAVLLADGRRLTYAEAGPRDGIPVIYCHGAIGTPLGGRSISMRSRGTWVSAISPSAGPGIGGSDPAADRTVLVFAERRAQLADRLGLGRFSVIGVSAGGPYALAPRTSSGAGRAGRAVQLAVAAVRAAPDARDAAADPARARASSRAHRRCAARRRSALPVIRRHPVLLSHVIAAHAAPGRARATARSPTSARAASASFLDARPAACAG